MIWSVIRAAYHRWKLDTREPLDPVSENAARRRRYCRFDPAKAQRLESCELGTIGCVTEHAGNEAYEIYWGLYPTPAIRSERGIDAALARDRALHEEEVRIHRPRRGEFRG